MNNEKDMYVNLADILFRAVKNLKFSAVLNLDNKKIFELRNQVLKIFYKNYELRDYSGELVIADRSTGEIVRDQFFNTLSLSQVLNLIAKKVYPVMVLEKEVQSLPSEQAFTKLMRKSGIPKHSSIRRELFQEWVHAHQDDQVRQASEYWY